MPSAAPIVLQADQHCLGRFFSPLKIRAHGFLPLKKTKCITAEKLNFYLGQYKFEAYSVFKYKHICHLFSLRKQYKACAKFQWERTGTPNYRPGT